MTDADAAVAAVQVELLTKNRKLVTSDQSLHTLTLQFCNEFAEVWIIEHNISMIENIQ